MSYASKQDMIDRIGERDLVLLTDRDGALDAIDDTVLTTRLEDATAQINGYLVKRHALPFDEVPRVLIGLTCDIAYYNLLGTQSGASETATRRYDQAIAFLRQVARGEASLGDETPADTEETSPGAVLVEGPEPTFSRKSLGGF